MKQYEILKLIAEDMQEPLSYVPEGLLWGAVFAVCAACCDFFLRNMRGKQLVWHVCGCFLLGIYAAVLLEQGFFSRAPGSRTSISMQLLETWQGGAQSKAYVIENLLMFVPFGLLVPFCFRRARTVFSTVPLAFMLSVLLEYTQYLTQRGHAQADDVLMNTLGAAAGFLLFCAGLFVFRSKVRS